jgi:hypothetical protein
LASVRECVPMNGGLLRAGGMSGSQIK